jgi:mannose-6-phosphate isomerase-like protein (cupin superfamily)
MKAFDADLKELAKDNSDFRRVVFTGGYAQLVVMAIEGNDEIGDEVHSADQILYAVEGEGEAIIDGRISPFKKGDVVAVPAGARHNVRNLDKKPLKLFTIYAPPQHPAGRVQATRAVAMVS